MSDAPHQMLDLAAVRREALAMQDAAQAKQAEEAAPAPLVTRHQTLHIVYQDADGIERRASLISRAPDREDRQAIAFARARLCLGVPFEQYIPEDQNRIRALASLSILVDEIPDWLAQAIEADDGLLFAVYWEVEGHAARYFRGDGGEGQGDPQKPRLAISRSPLPR